MVNITQNLSASWSRIPVQSTQSFEWKSSQ